MATITTPTGSINAGAQEIIVTAVTGVAVVVVLYWLAKREIADAADAVGDAAAKAAKTVGAAIDPTADTNLAYRGYNALGRAMTGDPNFTAADDIESIKKLVGTDLNPADNDNFINRGVTAVVRGVTGDKNATLGTKIYDGVEWLRSVW